MKDFQSRRCVPTPHAPNGQPAPSCGVCRIKTEGVIDRVSQLFKGDRALILGFNTFLPDGSPTPIAHLVVR